MGRALLIINTEADREKCVQWARKAPWGTRVEWKASKRSLPQNDRLWAMLTDVAEHMRPLGKDFTTEEWKLLFMHAWGREIRFLPGLDHKTVVPVGQSSSDLSKQEMSDLIEFIYAWGAENGVTFNEPSDASPSSDAGSDGPQPSPDAQTVAAANSGKPQHRTNHKREVRDFLEDVVLSYVGDDCLVWPYGKDGTGRACIKIEGRSVAVHRYVCAKVHGEPPTPKHEAAHSCGMGHLPCVNPRHIRWATKEENEADKVSHGTAYRGERHQSAKLTENDVRSIRALYANRTARSLAEQFGVSVTNVEEILSGRKWGWLDKEPASGGPAPAGETEAREEPVASSAGDPYELPLLEKKRACIEKFLNAATDPTLPDAKDRQATVIFAKDAWKSELPDDHAFVKACTDTANKVVKGELSAPVARHYLEGLL